jgi:hypothetical protein
MNLRSISPLKGVELKTATERLPWILLARVGAIPDVIHGVSVLCDLGYLEAPVTEIVR